eukprot:7261-Heterococcus_DN1.PRE.1
MQAQQVHTTAQQPTAASASAAVLMTALRLIGCRVSCLIDSREWQEAIVVAFQRCSSSSSSSSSSSAACVSDAPLQPQHISGFATCANWRSGKHLLQMKGSEKRW